jgi:stage III sporulation protein SpoIIIAA
MERRGTDNPLSQRILSSGAPVVVVRGPAWCGKTTAALAIYRRYQDEHRHELVPAGESLGGLRGVSTTDSLAEFPTGNE